MAVVKILAIRFARLGDVILLLPALASLKAKFSDSELTLLTGHRCAPIAELCPAIDRVIAVDRVAMRDGPAWQALKGMASLVRDVRREHFNLVVDFHSFRETNVLTWLSGAPLRIGLKRYKAPYWSFCFTTTPVVEDKTLHVAEMFQRVVASVPPVGVAETHFGPSSLGRVNVEKAEPPTLVLYVDAPVPERIWPPEQFAEVADYAIERLQAAVIVISSTQGSELAARVRAASRNADRLRIRTDLDLPQLVAVVASADLLISNDTGPMHVGPAVGVRTLGLFSVGYPEHFRPTGIGDKFLRGNPIREIRVDEVIETMVGMWPIADRGLRY
jgi:ADP-heptose:LPS heptosyltransferase